MSRERIALRRVALVGLMGSGKSRVGERLARALDWPFHDLDRRVAEEAGRSIPEIFRTEGEAGFRRREAGALAAVAALDPPLIAATGGGVVLAAENRSLLASAFTVVWLRVDPAEAARRVGGDPDRPLLGPGSPVERLRELARVRDPLYAAIAHLAVPTGAGTTPESRRDAVLAWLREGQAVDPTPFPEA